MRKARSSKEEIEKRKVIATQIYNHFKDNPDYLQSDVVYEIQKELNLKRHIASKLVRSLGFYKKRESITHTPSGNENTLICPKCGIEKPKEEFPRKGYARDGKVRYSYCKKCHSEYQAVLHIKRQFSLSTDDYEKLGQICSICGRPRRKNKLSVDHNHKNGLIRGILCMRCNRGIAWFEDNPELLEMAASYLRIPPATYILGKEVYGRTGRVSKKRGRKKTYKPTDVDNKKG